VYPKNGGMLEKAAQMANHGSPCTTQLYDRRRMVNIHSTLVHHFLEMRISASVRPISSRNSRATPECRHRGRV
jgi:hypothetical protein